MPRPPPPPPTPSYTHACREREREKTRDMNRYVSVCEHNQSIQKKSSVCIPETKALLLLLHQDRDAYLISFFTLIALTPSLESSRSYTKAGERISLHPKLLQTYDVPERYIGT